MDLKSVSTKIAGTSSARCVNRALDVLAPLCVPVAQRWDEEAERRKALRTPENLRRLMDAQRAYNSARSTASTARSQRQAARRATSNPLSAERRAARTADRAARRHRREAREALREARRSYPLTMGQLAARAHAVHAVPAALTSYAMSTPQDWTVWPAVTSAGLIAAHAATLWLGRRGTSAPAVADDGATAEERRLMGRLDPAYWVAHAEERGLAGTVTTPPQLTPAGIECDVRLDGQWTVRRLRAAVESVRALLGARTEVPMLIASGSRGGWAVIRLRTRSAAPDGVVPWSPGDALGIDMVTGEDVRVPLGRRMLIAGMSGAGKSTASRPLLYDASEGPTNALVIIDLKCAEGRLWDHRARVAHTPEDVVLLVDELVEEMHDRLETLPKGQATLTPSRERPRITVVVDEGAEVISTCSRVQVVTGYTESGRPITETYSAVEGLDSIARMGRAACIDLWWMTQSPTYGDGVPRQIAKQLGLRIGLAVETPAEARVVFGEAAQEKGWRADELPMPGVAMVRDGQRPPDPVRVRYMDDATVAALPSQPIWRRGAGVAPAEAAPAGRPALRLVRDQVVTQVVTESGVPAQRTNRDRVLAAIRSGACTARAVVEATGLHKGTVSREVRRLVEAGAVTRAEDGSLTAGEVSA